MVSVTCLVCGPRFAAQAAVFLLGRQGLQDDVGGPETGQRHVGQVGERVLLGKRLAGFPPFSEEATLREQHYPLPVPAVVIFIQVIFQVDQLLVSVSFTLKKNERCLQQIF